MPRGRRSCVLSNPTGNELLMEEIVPGIFHWQTFHEHIRAQVSSYYLDAPGEEKVLLDPRLPPEGMEWFRGRTEPTDILLTNRHHYRHSSDFQRTFGCAVWCHQDGLHEFVRGEKVRGFSFGDGLPGGIKAVEVAAICPDETALYVPWARAVALADGVIRKGNDGPLGFVPDFLIGSEPETVKQGLLAALERLLDLEFDTLLLAHGRPLVGDGKEALSRFVSGRGTR